jgi:outer membrane protein assembly factor BamB
VSGHVRSTVTERWARQFQTAVTGLDPVPGGGRVLATVGETVRALSTADGASLWRSAGERVVTVTPTTAYLATDATLVAVDVDTGAERWRYEAPAQFFYEGRTAGTVYLAAGPPAEEYTGTTVLAIDEESGDVRFERRFPGAASVDVSPWGALVTTVGTDRDGVVASIAPDGGGFDWDRGFDSRVTWATRVGDGSLVCVDLSDGVAVLDAEGGTVRWSVRRIDAAPVIVLGAQLYIGDRDADRLRACSLASGEEQWTAPGGDIRRLDRDAERLYVCTWDDRLRAVVPETGQRVWGHSMAATVAHLVVFDDLVCVRTDDGTASAVDPTDGTVRWRATAGATTIVDRVGDLLLAVDADRRAAFRALATGRTVRDTGATVHAVDATTLLTAIDGSVRALAVSDA